MYLAGDISAHMAQAGRSEYLQTQVFTNLGRSLNLEEML